MRDPKRIDDFCDRLKVIWKQVPDWRFGQFIANTMGEVSQRTNKDIFFIEEPEMIQTLEEMFNITQGETDANSQLK